MYGMLKKMAVSRDDYEQQKLKELSATVKCK